MIGFWEPKWRQVGTKIGSKIDLNFGRRFFKKQCFSIGKTGFLEIQGVEVGRKIRPKIDEKWKPKWSASWDGFLKDFCWILGAKMGWKIDQKSKTNRDRNGVNIRSFLESLLERDFFGQEAAKTRRDCSQERAAGEADGAGEDYGGV